MNNGFHFRLEVVKYGGAVTSERDHSWPRASKWFRKEAGMQIFPHRSVKVYLCVSDAAGQLRTQDEVVLLEEGK